MASEIVRLRQESVGFVSDERLWLAHDGKTIVRDGDYRAWQLLVVKGGVIGDKVAKRLNLEKGIKIEPLETTPPKAKTVAPEAIEMRDTRPEKPSAQR